MARKTKGQRDYMERLRDPRWQKMRLEILDRAGWRCEDCGTGSVNLQIHHGFYERGLQAWEYPGEALYCLCDHCHEKAETTKADAYRELGLISPWHQVHAVALLLDLQRLLADDTSKEALNGLTVERE